MSQGATSSIYKPFSVGHTVTTLRENNLFLAIMTHNQPTDVSGDRTSMWRCGFNATHKAYLSEVVERTNEINQLVEELYLLYTKSAKFAQAVQELPLDDVRKEISKARRLVGKTRQRIVLVRDHTINRIEPAEDSQYRGYDSAPICGISYHAC